MRFPGAGPGGAVAAEHRLGAPAGEAHEVGSLAAGGAPQVGEGVAELVRMETFDAGLEAAAANDLRDAGVGDRTLGTDPEGRRCLLPVAGSRPHVSVERLSGLATERHSAVAATLASHPHDVVAEVHVVELHRGDLCAART